MNVKTLRWSESIQKVVVGQQERIVLYAGFSLVLACALLLRWFLLPHQTDDFNLFVGPWYDFIHAHGLHAFRNKFADYTPPYLYLLYIGTRLPFSKLIAIKLISVLFDLVLAVGIYKVVRYFRPSGAIPFVAALTSLYLPTVFLNSAFWGQCDAIYVSFLVFCFYAILRDRYMLGWSLWAVAFSFKLQAIFFLPVLLVLWLRRLDKWYEPLVALPIILALTFSPILVGHPLKSLATVYLQQASSYRSLALGAPTFYQWIPDTYFKEFSKAGVMLAAGSITLIVLCLYLYAKNRAKDNLVMSCALLTTIPFLLPQMHERYFYPAEIFSVLLAFVSPRYFWVAIGMQLITLFAYTPYLLHISPAIALNLLPVGVIAIIAYLFKCLFVASPATHVKRIASTPEVDTF